MNTEPNQDPLAEGMEFDDLFATDEAMPDAGRDAAVPDVDTGVETFEVAPSLPEEATAADEVADMDASDPDAPEMDSQEQEVAGPEDEETASIEAETAPAPEAASAPTKPTGLGADDKRAFSNMLADMNTRMEALTKNLRDLGDKKGAEQPKANDDRALPAASPAAEEATRLAEAATNAAHQTDAEEEAARAAAEEIARQAAHAAAIDEAERRRAEETAATEAAQAAAAEEAARQAAAAAAREEAARQAVVAEEVARQAAATEEAVRQAAAVEEAAREAAAAEEAARQAAAAEEAARQAAVVEESARQAAATEEAARQVAEEVARQAAEPAIDEPYTPLEEDPFHDDSDAFAAPSESFEALEPGATRPKLSIPSDSPFADDEDAQQGTRQSPPVGPAEGVNEYEPAYAELDEDFVGVPEPGAPQEETPDFAALTSSPAATPAAAEPASPAVAPREPMDLLWAIATVDPEAEASQQSQQAARQARAQAAAEDSGKGKKQKVKLDPLPFEALVAGTPLIGTVFSPSGGVGKSSTAMNLAVYIAAIADAMAKKRIQRGEQNVRIPRVLLLDGDVVQGSLALRLKGEVTPSMHTLMLYLDDRQEAGFQGEDRWPTAYEDGAPGEKAMRDFVMWPEVLPNLNLLASPDEPDLFFDFGPKEYRELLKLLSRFYDIIIIDAGTEVVMESNRAWLGHANDVFLITAPEIDRIYNASKAARYIATSRPHPQDDSPEPQKLPPLVTADKLSVVMTRYDIDSGLDPEMLMDESFQWLRDRPNQRFYVPDVSKDMTKANNTGRFLVLEDSAYAKVIGKLAKHMFGRYQQQRQRALPPTS